MARFFRKRVETKSTSPGSLIFIGRKKMEISKISITEFNHDDIKEFEVDEVDGLGKYAQNSNLTWINIDGLHDTDIIRKIGEEFNLHALLLEDILNTDQRPKIDEYDNCIYIVLKMLQYNEAENIIDGEQLSMILGNSYLITFQEQTGDVFDPLRNRLRKNKGSRVREFGIDYMAYAMLDLVVDHYIDIIERVGEKVEDLEDDIFENISKETIEEIHIYKRELNYLGKIIRPCREFVNQLSKLDNELISGGTLKFLKDLEDHTMLANDAIDTYREMLSDHLNVYHSNVSNRLNDIMRILTIFSAIFIPLTFIAGVYGTNFEYLPELNYRYSYFIFWLVLVVVAIFMILFFKRKKWL